MRTKPWYAALAPLLLLLHSAAAAQQPRMTLVARGGVVVPVLALRSGLVGGDERRGVGSLLAGDLEAWPARSLGLRVGAEAEATPIHYGGLKSGDARVLTVGGSLLAGRERADHRRTYAAVGGGMRLYRVRRPGSSSWYEHGSPALYLGGGGGTLWGGLEIGLEVGAWFSSYAPQSIPSPGPRATQADGTLTLRVGLPILGRAKEKG